MVAPTPASADPAPSTTVLSVSNDKPLYQTAITLQAQVTGAGIPTGTVTFVDGATTLGSAPLDATGLAQLSITTLIIGPHSIVASYSGDADNSPSVSTAATVTVFQRTKTDLLVYSRPKTAASTWTPTTPLVLVANVIKSAPLGTKRAVTGTVSFLLDGVKTVVPVSGLHAAGLEIPNGLSLCTHTASAHYNGDGTFATSNSATRFIKINRNLTTSIAATPDPVAAGADVTYTITVTNNGLASAAAVHVTDTLPAGTTLVSASTVGGCTGTAPVNCLVGTVPLHASRTATIVAQTPPEPTTGTLTDTATAIPGANNIATVTTAIGP